MDDRPDLHTQFRERYRIVNHPAMLRAEHEVIGGDFGAASYTTMAQADEMADCLELGPGRLLLDVGSGAGWPAIYLAAATGCTAVLSDPTFEGMSVAHERARRDDLAALAVVASGAALPFKTGVFDAALSSDAY